MKQLTDEVFAQVRDVLQAAEDFCSLNEAAGKALAALDTAQPVQVNAMLVEALNACHIALYYIRETSGIWMSAEGIAEKALAAAKQAQPEPKGLNPLWVASHPDGLRRAQTERAPLTDAEIEKLREKTFSTNNPFCPVDSKSMRKAVRAAEAAHGIKQGGKHE